jgi:hypothetical protein
MLNVLGDKTTEYIYIHKEIHKSFYSIFLSKYVQIKMYKTKMLSVM